MYNVLTNYAKGYNMQNTFVTNIWVNVQLGDLVTYKGHEYCVIRIYRKANELLITPVT